MCRYAAYLGPSMLLSELIYKPTNSLVHQAMEAMQSRTRINADGFGVGWYVPEISPEPAVFKDISPVWNNYNLGSIARKISSPGIMAHVRSAKSFDPVNRENCHPFARGRLLWMHNGDIPGRARLARQVGQQADDVLLAQIRGNTDSEMALTVFLTHLDNPLDREPEVDELAAAMKQTLQQLTAWHREARDERPLELNFCVTNGHALVATRFAISPRTTPSLHWYVEATIPEERSVLVASEPLYPGEGWREVQDAGMVLVHPDLSVEQHSLEDLA
jgi:predicted glutamine amidotransferase